MALFLASRSPRRAELLAGIGLAFRVRAADVDETVGPGEAPEGYVVRLARAKAETVFESLRAELAPEAAQHAVVLGADTTVVVDGRILGKPVDAGEAVDMLLTLSGREHRVMTAIAAHAAAGCRSRCVTTHVCFRTIEPWEARAYADSGEGADKAGGYGIQGIGGIFAESIRGSYSAVVGLPLAQTEALLRDCGFDTWLERRKR